LGAVDDERMTMPVTITVSKEAILAHDVGRVREILDSFVPDLIDRNRNRVELEILGYGNDSRELFLIDEVRHWYHTLFDCTPDLFFWMNLRSPWLTFYAIMFGTPVCLAGGTTVSPDDLQRFLVWGYQSLNGFCAQTRLVLMNRTSMSLRPFGSTRVHSAQQSTPADGQPAARLARG